MLLGNVVRELLKNLLYSEFQCLLIKEKNVLMKIQPWNWFGVVCYRPKWLVCQWERQGGSWGKYWLLHTVLIWYTIQQNPQGVDMSVCFHIRTTQTQSHQDPCTCHIFYFHSWVLKLNTNKLPMMLFYRQAHFICLLLRPPKNRHWSSTHGK